MNTNERIEQMKKEILRGCRAMQLNICDICQSKKECCELAWNDFNTVGDQLARVYRIMNI